MGCFVETVRCPICDSILCKSINEKNFWNCKKFIDRHMREHECAPVRGGVVPCFIEYISDNPVWRSLCFDVYGASYYNYRLVKVRYASGWHSLHPRLRWEIGQLSRLHQPLSKKKSVFHLTYKIPPSVGAFFERMDDYINRMGFLNLVNDVDKRIYAIWLTHPNKPIKEIAEETNCCIKRVKGVIAQTHVAIQDGLLEEMVEGVL